MFLGPFIIDPQNEQTALNWAKIHIEIPYFNLPLIGSVIDSFLWRKVKDPCMIQPTDNHCVFSLSRTRLSDRFTQRVREQNDI